MLGLVINPEGFIKYSSILEGNMADCKTLEGMIGKLRVKTSSSARKALVVIDAGIATEENLKMILENGYEYLCVSRSNLKDYYVKAGAATVIVTDNRKQKIELCQVSSGHNTDYYLKVESHTKEENVWQFYNTIREVEATFRVLKSDLDLRPVYHQNDESTMAHLHLGLLAYWLVNIVRHQLKKEDIHSNWREIIRTMNTQKAVTTLAQNSHEEVIKIRRCSEPNQMVRKLYDALKYKYAPFVKRKSVVHKSELENCQFIEKQQFRSD